MESYRITTDGILSIRCLHVVLASRENTSPVAVVKPSTQDVNEPNDLVIDGSGALSNFFHFIMYLLCSRTHHIQTQKEI